jgi:hypothetical protein
MQMFQRGPRRAALQPKEEGWRRSDQPNCDSDNRDGFMVRIDLGQSIQYGARVSTKSKEREADG